MFFQDYVIRRLRNEFPAKPELAPRAAGNTEQQALHWLSWLARTMRERGQTVFHPDLMQPDLLSSRAARWLLPPRFAGAVGLVAALLFGVLTGLLVHAINPGRPGSGVTAGVIEGTVAGLACAAQCRRREIEPARPPRLGAAALLRVLPRGLGWGAAGAIIGAAAGSWFGTMAADASLGTPLALLAVGICGWLLGGTAGGATLGALTGLALGAVTRLHAEPNVRPSRPGAGMRDTRRIAMIAGGVTVAVATVAYGVHFGAALGTVVALRVGGATYLRHLMLRALLARAGVIPRHLLTFLHDAHTSVLLTEVGGGYTFSHPLLRDYLAGIT